MQLKQLDVRPIPVREKHPTIFASFDALKNGEGFQLINDHDPIPLYYQLNAERPSQFRWEYVERGPEIWSVNIFKV